MSQEKGRILDKALLAVVSAGLLAGSAPRPEAATTTVKVDDAVLWSVCRISPGGDPFVDGRSLVEAAQNADAVYYTAVANPNDPQNIGPISPALTTFKKVRTPAGVKTVASFGVTALCERADLEAAFALAPNEKVKRLLLEVVAPIPLPQGVTTAPLGDREI